LSAPWASLGASAIGEGARHGLKPPSRRSPQRSRAGPRTRAAEASPPGDRAAIVQTLRMSRTGFLRERPRAVRSAHSRCQSSENRCSQSRQYTNGSERRRNMVKGPVIQGAPRPAWSRAQVATPLRSGAPAMFLCSGAARYSRGRPSIDAGRAR
jgi:hypothetical protein